MNTEETNAPNGTATHRTNPSIVTNDGLQNRKTLIIPTESIESVEQIELVKKSSIENAGKVPIFHDARNSAPQNLPLNSADRKKQFELNDSEVLFPASYQNQRKSKLIISSDVDKDLQYTQTKDSDRKMMLHTE